MFRRNPAPSPAANPVVRRAARGPLASRFALFEGLETRQFLSVSPSAFPSAAPSHGPTSTSVGVNHSNTPATNADASDAPLKVFSWGDWGIDGVTPMVWAHLDYLTPQQAAAETIPQLLARDPGDRALFLKHLGDDFTDRSLDNVVRHGLNSNPDQQWLTEYFGLLASAGAKPDFIIIEYEGGVQYWQVNPADVRRIMSDPALKAKLPADLQQYDAAAFSDGRYREAITAWQEWANLQVRDALRDAVADPARAAFGTDIPMSNYGDVVTATTAYDHNGWGLHRTADETVAGWSSPSLYLGDGGQLYDGYADPAWASYVNNINTLRNSTAVDASRVAPWISNPSYAGGDRALWEAQLNQIRASGVKTVLLWNAGYDADTTAAEMRSDRDFAAGAFGRLFAQGNAVGEVADGAYQRLALDTASVDVDGVAVTRVGRRLSFPTAVASSQFDDGETKVVRTVPVSVVDASADDGDVTPTRVVTPVVTPVAAAPKAGLAAAPAPVAAPVYVPAEKAAEHTPAAKRVAQFRARRAPLDLESLLSRVARASDDDLFALREAY